MRIKTLLTFIPDQNQRDINLVCLKGEEEIGALFQEKNIFLFLIQVYKITLKKACSSLKGLAQVLLLLYLVVMFFSKRTI